MSAVFVVYNGDGKSHKNGTQTHTYSDILTIGKIALVSKEIQSSPNMIKERMIKSYECKWKKESHILSLYEFEKQQEFIKESYFPFPLPME